MEVLTVHGTCFGPKHFPYSYYECRASDIAAVGTTLAICAEPRTHHLPDARHADALRFMPRTREYIYGYNHYSSAPLIDCIQYSLFS